MKKSFIFLTLFVTVFSSTFLHAETFSLINSNFHIYGALTEIAVYNKYASIPIIDDVVFSDAGAHAMSSASFFNVYAEAKAGSVHVGCPECAIEAVASAITTLDFRPDFSGLGPKINFYTIYQDLEFERIQILLTDLTTSIEILNIDPLTHGDNQKDYDLTYAEWNSLHVYRLIMNAWAASTWSYGGLGQSGIATDIKFSNVPEPATMLLLGLGLIGLAGIRRKFKN
jgi:hypothetical protein